MKLCIECHKKPIVIKKYSLCMTCYGIKWRNQELQNLRVYKTNDLSEYVPDLGLESIKTSAVQAAHEKGGEIEFIKNYFTHNNWIHQPARFRLNGNTLCYEPDFYDGERDVFIEVIRTRQRYHQAKPKYRLFRELFPNLKFEIRKPTGELLNEDTRAKNWQTSNGG